MGLREMVGENAEQFAAYYKLLVEWNKKINLTAITEEADVYAKHFMDSLAVVLSGKIKDGQRVVDIGTGAGFPGLVLAIHNPSLSVVLLDSLNKRVTFLNEVIEALELKNVTAVHGRAEDFAKQPDFRERFDAAVSRAVAALPSLLELCLPFVKVGGFFIAQKGPAAYAEADAAKNAVSTLGGQLESIFPYQIPDADLDHNLVLVKKIAQTSTKYPRKSPKPIKDPLK